VSAAAPAWSDDRTALPSPLAPPLSRVVTYLIDVVTVFALSLALVKRIGWVAAFGLAVVVVQLLYLAAFEGSGLQANPGKLLLGVRVVATSGDGISFGRTLARRIAKSVTATLGFLVRLLRGRPSYHDSAAMSSCFAPSPPGHQTRR
jgi:uncharacterized RDD family membrane protein YckC